MGELGVFLRTAVTAKAEKHKASLLLQWTATHADEKSINKLTKSDNKPTNDAKDVKKNWRKMKKFFGEV